ncbi:MAG: hypothetical protein ACRD3T_12360 [Terriglobia bacterium]
MRKKLEMLFLINEAEKLLKTKDRRSEKHENEPESSILSGEILPRKLLKTQDGVISFGKRTGTNRKRCYDALLVPWAYGRRRAKGKGGVGRARSPAHGHAGRWP